MKRRRPILTVVVAATLFLVAVIAIWRTSVASANKGRLRAIAARGEPTSLAELNTFYKAVPDQSNAAPLWLKGNALDSGNVAGVRGIGGRLSLKRGMALKPEQLGEAIEALAASTEALALVHQAAELDQSRFPVTLSNESFTNILEQVAAMKGAAQMLRVQAAVAIATTNTALASRAISGIFAASHSVAQQPLVISQLVGYAMDAIGVQTLEFALNAAQFTESELALMQAAVSKADDPERAARGLIGERTFFISGLSDPGRYIAAARGIPVSGIEEIVSETLVFPLTRLTGFWQRDFRFGVDALTTNIAWARLPDPQRFQSATNAVRFITQAQRGYYMMSATLLPALEKYLLRDALHRAQLRTALAALAVERFCIEQKHQLPTDLPSMAPHYFDRTPVDPYDGHGLRYRRTPKGYVVYSIGPDAKDDGGIEPPAGPKPKALWDVTFIVERPETR